MYKNNSQGGCERRSEVIVSIKKNNRGMGVGSGGEGVRVDVNEEFKFL